jgi:hypothetical protein
MRKEVRWALATRPSLGLASSLVQVEAYVALVRLAWKLV